MSQSKARAGVNREPPVIRDAGIGNPPTGCAASARPLSPKGPRAMNAFVSRTSRPLYAVSVLAAAGAVLAACGGGTSSGGGSTAGTNAGQSTGVATVSTHSGPAGVYLTGDSGRALYVFSADHGTTSRCAGACAEEWMPFLSSSTSTAAGHAVSARIGTTTRPGGDKQVTYAGHPLYYFDGDQSANETNGAGLDDFGGVWSLVTPSGAVLATAGGSSSDDAGTSSSSGGYSYGH
jgi:predicted lipoprotein with Yx(FWY)xxD motif